MYRANRQAIKQKLLDNCFNEYPHNKQPYLPDPHKTTITLQQHLSILSQLTAPTTRSKSPFSVIRMATPQQQPTVVHVTMRKPVSLSRDSSLQKLQKTQKTQVSSNSVQCSPCKTTEEEGVGERVGVLRERRQERESEEGRRSGKEEVVNKTPKLRRKKSGLKITSNFRPCILGEGVHRTEIVTASPYQSILRKIHKEQNLQHSSSNLQNLLPLQSSASTSIINPLPRPTSTKKKLNLTQPHTLIPVDFLPTSISISSSSLAK